LRFALFNDISLIKEKKMWLRGEIVFLDSALVNGTPFGFFSSSRALRQGDPLSPLLFVIVMEALSKLFSITIQRGFLSGFSVGTGSNGMINISHMLFTDNTLVFCRANPDHLLYLRMLLLSFEAVSSLKINLDKSVLVSVGHVDNMDDLAGILGCGVSSLPLKYLGLPLGAPFKAKSSLDEVVGKIEKWLASWKQLYLSKGGKVTLIKGTLSNLLTYFLSLFPIPSSVASRIEKLH